ncbi:ATP-binding cassette domain-containing protein [Paeniroseomonas aquatica]|uniref:ATP-binding cassette domain-containing protein n=1 Tax=Paeniroseomonas aquatica TaxID=373043 RepID=A0ABT8A7L2_9PROT|nr:ATP-binding cassette domain-containing protein [Paeniroseomonas aquatica]MDN3565686.1 ATP-binding cassette domain-containing protein [Paeniroseomonas aquatica]
MAQAPLERPAEALLREAIETVMKTANGWIKLLVALGLVSTLASFAMLFSRMELIRRVPITQSYDSIESILVFWAAILAVIAVLGFLQGIAFTHLSRFISSRLGVPAVLATAQRAGRPEAISSAVLADLEMVRTTLAGAASHTCVALIASPLLVPLLMLVHFYYAVVALLFCFAALLISLALARAANQAAALTTNSTAQAYGLAADAMRSGEAVLAMGMLPRLVRLWTSVSTDTAGEAWLAQRKAARLTLALDVLMGSFRGTIVFLGTVLAFSGARLDPAWAGAVLVVFQLIKPFTEFGETRMTLGEGLAAWRRLRALVRDTTPVADGIPFPCPHGRLVVEHMSFAFRGPVPPLLRNIELTVEPGSIVAIVGASGGGKSTLLRLLVGLFRPTAGGVYLDGHATHQWDRRDFARHVGFLPQEPLLSRGTAAEVIARLEEPDMELVLEASRRAGAHDIIAGLPQGYATEISGNYQLSMGQRHRIALARALYGRPKLLLLDELAGSMDQEGEAQVAALLGLLRQEGTSVVFSTHRPGLVAVADRVLALRNGTLVPAGEELPRLLGTGRGGRPGRQAPEPVAIGQAPAQLTGRGAAAA